MRTLTVALFLLAPQVGRAACEKQAVTLAAATGPAVAPAFAELATCNAQQGNDQFAAAVKKTGDIDSLAALARTAIGLRMIEPVYGLLETIPDYSARAEVARALGAVCSEDPQVLAFLVGAHAALKDRAFVGWSPAMAACPDPAMSAELQRLAADVPPRGFDDKYASVVELYATREKVASLGVLEKAAVKASQGGPFPVVVDAMVKAVTPAGIGARPADADRDALVASLKKVAAAATPDQVTKLADVFVAIGAGSEAASLLPKIYPDRVQSDGTFLYGVAGVETCADDVLVHFAVVREPGKRWSIVEDVQATAAAFKPKLKCKTPAPLAVQVTPGPVKTEGEVAAWAESLAQHANAEAKTRAEPAITLQ